MRYIRSNNPALVKALDKLQLNELTIEEILDEEDLVYDLRGNTDTKLAKMYNFNFIIIRVTNEVLIKLIDYATKKPKIDNLLIGRKFPFNASEILTTESHIILDLVFEETKISIEDEFTDEISSNEGSEISDDVIEQNEINDKVETTLNKDQRGSNSDLIVVFVNEGEQPKSVYKIPKKSSKEQIETCVEVSDEASKSKSFYLILDYFFNFDFDNTGDDTEHTTYVLSGYFLKIFTNLMNVKSQVIIDYISDHLEVIDKMIQFLDLSSISECILRIFDTLHKFTDKKELKENIFYKKTTNLIILIIEKIFKSAFDCKINDKHLLMENISYLLLESFSGNIFYEFFMENLPLFEMLNKLLLINLTNDIVSQNILKILIKINENILRSLGIPFNEFFTRDTGINWINQEEELHIIKKKQDDKFFDKNYSQLNNIENVQFLSRIQTLFNSIYSTWNKVIEDMTNNKNYLARLGVKRLIEFEYIKSVLEVLINLNEILICNGQEISLTEIIQEEMNINFKSFLTTNFIQFSISSFFTYELNNMYQNLFVELINIFTHKNCPDTIIDQVFSNKENCCKFLDQLIQYSTYDLEERLINNTSIASGCFSQIIKISNTITNSSNDRLIEILNEKENKFKFFSETFIEPIQNIFNKGLLIDVKSKFYDPSELDEYEYTEQKLTFTEMSKNSLSYAIKKCISNFLKGGVYEDEPTEDFEQYFENNAEFDNAFTEEKIDDELKILILREETQNNKFYDNVYWGHNLCINFQDVLKDLI